MLKSGKTFKYYVKIYWKLLQIPSVKVIKKRSLNKLYTYFPKPPTAMPWKIKCGRHQGIESEKSYTLKMLSSSPSKKKTNGGGKIPFVPKINVWFLKFYIQPSTRTNCNADMGLMAYHFKLDTEFFSYYLRYYDDILL